MRTPQTTPLFRTYHVCNVQYPCPECHERIRSQGDTTARLLRPHTPARLQRCPGRVSHQAGQGTSRGLPQMTAQVVEIQVQQNPQLASQREVLQRFLTKHMHWDSVKEDTITAYTQEFTEPELKKLTEFYKTPLGKKANEKMPKLAFISGQIGLKKAQENQAELRQMLTDQPNKPGGGG